MFYLAVIPTERRNRKGDGKKELGTEKSGGFHHGKHKFPANKDGSPGGRKGKNRGRGNSGFPKNKTLGRQGQVRAPREVKENFWEREKARNFASHNQLGLAEEKGALTKAAKTRWKGVSSGKEGKTWEMEVGTKRMKKTKMGIKGGGGNGGKR